MWAIAPAVAAICPPLGRRNATPPHRIALAGGWVGCKLKKLPNKVSGCFLYDIDANPVNRLREGWVFVVRVPYLGRDETHGSHLRQAKCVHDVCQAIAPEEGANFWFTNTFDYAPYSDEKIRLLGKPKWIKERRGVQNETLNQRIDTFFGLYCKASNVTPLLIFGEEIRWTVLASLSTTGGSLAGDLKY